jgi:hypothetical protein
MRRAIAILVGDATDRPLGLFGVAAISSGTQQGLDRQDTQPDHADRTAECQAGEVIAVPAVLCCSVVNACAVHVGGWWELPLYSAVCSNRATVALSHTGGWVHWYSAAAHWCIAAAHWCISAAHWCISAAHWCLTAAVIVHWYKYWFTVPTVGA